MRRRIHFPIVVGLFVGLCLSAGLMHAVHAFQMGRHANTFLQHADQAEAEKDPGKAIEFVKRYLTLQPDDVDARERLGTLLATHTAANPTAFLMLERVLRLDPSRDAARQLLVKVALRMGRYTDAIDHLDNYLLKPDSTPSNSELLLLKATALRGQGKDLDAAELYQSILTEDPTLIDVYTQLASLQRQQLDQPAEAIATIIQMVQENADSAEAHLRRGSYLLEYRDEPEVVSAMSSLTSAATPIATNEIVIVAADDGQRALQLDPDNLPARILLARCAEQQGQWERAEQLLLAAREQDPKLAAVYSALARVATRQSPPRTDRAIQWLIDGAAATKGDATLLWNLTSLLIDQKRTDEARTYLNKLQQRDTFEPSTQLLRARISASEGHWAAALDKLKAVRPALTNAPELAAQADYWIGISCRELGYSDLTLPSFRAAIRANPHWIPARLEAARSLFQLGKIQQALEEFEEIARLPDAPGDVLLELTRLTILSVNRLEAAKRDWAPVERYLAAAERLMPSAEQLPMLWAVYHTARGDNAKATEVIEQGVIQHPDSEGLWVGLAAIAQNEGRWDDTEQVFQRARPKLGESPMLEASYARFLIRRNADTTPDLTKIVERVLTWTKPKRLEALRQLADLAVSVEDNALTKRLCQQVAELDPNDLRVRLVMFDLALQSGQADNLAGILQDVRRIEGDGPLWHYGEAVRITLQARESDDPSVYSGALDHLIQAGRDRPGWSAVPVLRGEVHELIGDDEAALSQYLFAIELGRRDPKLLTRAIRLLYGRERYVEADQLIRDIQQRQTVVSSELLRVAAEIAIRLDDNERALAVAQRAAKDSGDAHELIWVGQVQSMLGHSVEAVETLELAVARAPESSETWTGLVALYARQGNRTKTIEAIGRATDALPELEFELVAAAGFELLANVSEAEKHYAAALNQAPDDSRVLRRAFDFYRRHQQLSRIQPTLNRVVADRVLALPEDAAWARRSLAIALVSTGDHRQLDQALALIAENLRLDESSAPDLRARGVILSTRPDQVSMKEAMSIFERLVAAELATDADRYVLARLYANFASFEARSSSDVNFENPYLTKASNVLRGLVSSQPDEIRFVEAYARLLLARGEQTEANIWIERLQRLVPNGRTAIEMKAQILAKEDRVEELRTLLQNLGEGQAGQNTNVNPQIVAGLFEQFGRQLANQGKSADAASFLKEAEQRLTETGNEPTARLNYAAFLAREGKLDESFELAKSVTDQADPADVATYVVNVRRVAIRDEKLNGRLAAFLISAVASHPDSVPLLVTLGELHDQMGQYADAEQAYRSVLDHEPDNVFCLNNLAVLLAMWKNEVNESVGLINEAIEIAGAQAALLDSRAMIWLRAGELDNAQKDLDIAIKQASNGLLHFHRAIVAEKQGDVAETQANLTRAKQLMFQSEQLHRIELADERVLRLLAILDEMNGQ